jgi:hypothetical protein
MGAEHRRSNECSSSFNMFLEVIEIPLLSLPTLGKAGLPMKGLVANRWMSAEADHQS